MKCRSSREPHTLSAADAATSFPRVEGKEFFRKIKFPSTFLGGRRGSRSSRKRSKSTSRSSSRSSSKSTPPSTTTTSRSSNGGSSNSGGVHASCCDSGVDGGSEGSSSRGRGGLGDRGGFGGSPGLAQMGGEPAIVELGARSRAHAAHGHVRGDGAAAPRGAAPGRRAQAQEHDVGSVVARGAVGRGGAHELAHAMADGGDVFVAAPLARVKVGSAAVRHPDRLALADGRDGEANKRRLGVGVALGGFAVVRPHVGRRDRVGGLAVRRRRQGGRGLGQALGDALTRGRGRRRLWVLSPRVGKRV